MKILEGSWYVTDASELIVNHVTIPGKLIALHAGTQFQIVVLHMKELKRYQLRYPHHYTGSMEKYQALLWDFRPRKLSVTQWAPLRYWKCMPSETRGHVIVGCNILQEEIKSSGIKAVKFISDAHATVLTFSERRDVWEVIPLWGIKEEFDDFKAYCQTHQIPSNPKADDNFMRHYKHR